MKSLWRDEGGAILSVELILIAVLVVIGLVVGLASLRDVVNAKLVELSAAVAAIDPGYGYGGIEYDAADTTANVTDGGWVAGSAYNSTMAPAEGFGTLGQFDPVATLSSEDVSSFVDPMIVSQ